MIVSTGDELVGVDEIPLEHQIRRSNVFTLVSLLERLNIPSETAHITDDKPILKSKIENYLQEYDVLLFSGAVSKGKYDFLPEVFDELGVEKLFHKVAQRPGKPFWFGRKSFLNENDLNSDNQTNDKYKKNTIVFGFPGNPISTFVNCVAYFYPWYYKSVDIKAETETAILNADVSFKPNLTYFLQVKLSSRFGHLIATPIIGNGSGDLASLVKTDAFIQLPNDKTEFKKGEVFPIIRYR
ncbi:molybdopterin molybdotransferase MoeA [Polaribacter sejongensis]